MFHKHPLELAIIMSFKEMIAIVRKSLPLIAVAAQAQTQIRKPSSACEWPGGIIDLPSYAQPA